MGYRAPHAQNLRKKRLHPFYLGICRLVGQLSYLIACARGFTYYGQASMHIASAMKGPLPTLRIPELSPLADPRTNRRRIFSPGGGPACDSGGPELN